MSRSEIVAVHYWPGKVVTKFHSEGNTRFTNHACHVGAVVSSQPSRNDPTSPIDQIDWVASFKVAFYGRYSSR